MERLLARPVTKIRLPVKKPILKSYLVVEKSCVV
ncbi:unknown [[Mannheimia] succiniciproducens MBEL55E]|uniref:Uncharacterized protein n=1 Tax=Mannheimia succiniciproducens (strain KCTC 0769BP / MBEL55E) TaxID=221988 RepID=Q65SI7_MANSM|nr:unknown [[Mannheimia] succiniciproducens MBEL55E]